MAHRRTDRFKSVRTPRKLIRKMTADRTACRGAASASAIKAGGCSGLSYTFAWEPAPRDGDHVFEGAEGARVFVDPKSFTVHRGTTLDYDTSLVSKGFIFNNPNAKSSCGCGTSSVCESFMSTVPHETIEQLANREYKYGFVTDVDERDDPQGAQRRRRPADLGRRRTSRSGCSSGG